ncbi:hypothetical protein ACIP5Y_11270 [Nocardia sp. NPDC088792]|uniref:hypothetical protein n=1 Tax=Nocardia sp. NPDC088792 TaxID=3364332 RepID=UPI003824D3FE
MRAMLGGGAGPLLVYLANSIARQWPSDRPLEYIHGPLAAGDTQGFRPTAPGTTSRVSGNGSPPVNRVSGDWLFTSQFCTMLTPGSTMSLIVASIVIRDRGLPRGLG